MQRRISLQPSERGLALMVAASLAFSLMNLAAKMAAQHGVPVMQIACARSVVGALLVLLSSMARGVSLRVNNGKIMTLRTVAGTWGVFANFYAVGTIKLADASALVSTTPLFLGMFGALFLREKLSRLVIAALCVGFVGVLVILRPTLHVDLGGLVALSCGASSAIAMMSLRKLSETENAETVVFWFSLGAAIILGIAALPTAIMPAPIDIFFMTCAGAAASFGQYWMTQAYRLDVAARVGGAGYLSVVFAACIGAIFFDERFELVSFAGIVIVLLSGIMLVADARRERNASAQPQ